MLVFYVKEVNIVARNEARMGVAVRQIIHNFMYP